MKPFIGFCRAACACAFLCLLPFAVSAEDSAEREATTHTDPPAKTVAVALRESPSSSARVVAQVRAGDPLYIAGMRRNHWYTVQYGDGEWGYCPEEFLAPAPFYVGVVSHCARATVRLSPNGEESDRLPVGERVIVPLRGETADGDEWVRVIYDGCRAGYLRSAFLERMEPQWDAVPTAADLPEATEETPAQTPPAPADPAPSRTPVPKPTQNSSPNTTPVPKPTQPPAQSTKPVQKPTPAQAETAAPTVTEPPQTEPSEPSAPSGYAPISLSVPYYTQTDARWANLTVGQSGQSVRRIGCALTCYAMSESYFTRTAYTPDAVLRDCDFTPSGAIYWPAPYAKTVPDSPLDAVYRKLAAGIPVIWHGQRADGSSHWVLIYGFTGGEPKASSFLIRDPATASRTTLQQYLSAFPVFVKLVSR